MGYVGKANEHAVNGHYGLPHHLFNDVQHDFFGPHTSNYTHWLRTEEELRSQRRVRGEQPHQRERMKPLWSLHWTRRDRGLIVV